MLIKSVKNGPYELVIAPADYPGRKYRGRYVSEHHLVWWKHTGKLVPTGYVLHHKNEKKRDNRYSNLELKTVSAHAQEHGEKLKVPLTELRCAECGGAFEIATRNHRSKIRRGQKYFCCSRSCQVKLQWKVFHKARRSAHGTRSMYTGHGCRCEPCRKAQRVYMRKYNAQRSKDS